MVDPSQFDSMINWAFSVATFIYTMIGVTGYLMFGNDVCEEVSIAHRPVDIVAYHDSRIQFSQDLMRTPGYNRTLNRAAMWGLVLVPISKFALATRPVRNTLQDVASVAD